METTEFFRDEWPGMAKRIAASLGRRGVPACDRDDILQETALRLFRSWDQVDQGRPVEAYARTVANNIWCDVLRRGPREEPVEAVAEEATVDVVAATCVARDELGRVRRAILRLRPEQQVVLMDVAAEELGVTRTEASASDALRMSRMRARRQLRAVLKVASSVAVLLAALVRRGRLTATTSVALAVSALMLFSGTPDVGGAIPERPLGPALDTAERGPDLLAEDRPARVVTPVAPARKPSPARKRTAKPAEPQYWIVGTGPASVAVLLSVDVYGRGFVVSGNNGNGKPVCLIGIAPGTGLACED